jgi:hypothetical protein
VVAFGAEQIDDDFTIDRMMTYWLYRQLVRCDWWLTLGNDNGREAPQGKTQGKIMADLDIEGFLGHEPNAGGFEKGKYLRGWKKRKPAEVNIWLHTGVMFSSLWQHNLQRVVVYKNKDGDEVQDIWGNSWNCFSKETRFWANGRLISFEEVGDGNTVEVLAGDGEWRPAEVKRFGTAELRTIEIGFPGSNHVVEVEATANHRWFTDRGEVTDLKPGDRIKIEPADVAKGKGFDDGFVHGLVFGDGWRDAKGDARFSIRLCGDKQEHLARLEAYGGHVTTSCPPSYGGEPVVHLAALNFVDMKQVPNGGTSLEYQAGFLAGWMAADARVKGSNGSPSRELYSTNDAALDWVVERAPLLGYSVTGRSKLANEETNFGKRRKRVHILTLRPEPVEYRVRTIKETGRVEDVWCVVEPVTSAFTIEGGIVTGNCWEDEEVLSNRKRDADGEREAPIQICPVCKMIEWVRKAVRQGALQPHDPIFVYRTQDGKKERAVHAAGLYNGLDDDRFTDEQREAIKDAGIRLSDAWKENGNSKCNYMFCVVDHEHPEDGVQIAIETSLLGDKTKQVIKRLRKKNGENSNWNPLKTPYAICWSHNDKKGIPFNEKYDADDRPSLKITPEIETLIMGDPPDIEGIKKRGNVRKLREQLEMYAVVEMPFDEFFEDAERASKNEKDDDTDFAYGANVTDGEVSAEDLAKADAAIEEAEKAAAKTKAAPAKPTAQSKPAAEAAKAPETKAAPAKPAAEVTKPAGRKKVELKPKVEEVFIKCDDCGEDMREDWEKCPKCGATYEIEPEIKAKYADAKPEPKPDAGTHGDRIGW